LEKKRKSKKIVLLLIAVLVFGYVSIKHVYGNSISNAYSQRIISVFPLPAVKINNTTISMKDYLSEYKAIENFFKTSEGGEMPSESQLQETILDTLINKAIIKQLGYKNGIELDNEKVESFYAEVSSEGQGVDVFKEELRQNFGWTEDEFKKRIVHSIVFALQMNEFYLSDTDTQIEQIDIINKALERLVGGEDFFEVAKEVHGNYDVVIESDLGFQDLSELSDEVVLSIQDLQIGDMTDVVDLGAAYGIFKFEDKVVEAEDVKVHLFRIIVPKKTLEDVVVESLEDAKIKRYINN
jgi:hypothetical protein